MSALAAKHVLHDEHDEMDEQQYSHTALCLVQPHIVLCDKPKEMSAGSPREVTITYLDDRDDVVLSRSHGTRWEDEFVVRLFNNVPIIR